MGNEKKKAFIVYYDKRDMFEVLIEEKIEEDGSKSLSYDRIGRLFMALCDFSEYGESNIALDGMTKVAYKSMLPQLESDRQKYEAKCEKNRENINKRWSNQIRTNTNEYECIRSDTNYTDTDTDTDTDICSGIRETTRKRFSAPTLEEVKAYCLERENKVDAERFVDYYTSNGWKVGKNPMKDWKSAVRQWERNEYTQGGLTNERNNGNDSRRGEGENENRIGMCV